MTSTRKAAEADGEAQEPLYMCLHCTVVDLPESEMEPLENGEPSNCCKGCWQDYKEKEASERLFRVAAWRKSVKRETAEGERRHRMTKAQKAREQHERDGQEVIEWPEVINEQVM